MYHAVRGARRARTSRVFLTDSAVGTQEENNLRHLVTNLGRDVPRERVVPFLTSKHSLEFCLSYAEQAWQHGFPALVVLGGDKTVGRPRCVEHAWELRRAIRDARAAAGARRLGEPVRRRRAAGRLPRRRPLHGGVLPDADRQPSRRRAGRALHRGNAPPRRSTTCRACSASSTTAAPTRRRCELLSQFLPVPVDGACSRVRRRRHAGRRLRPHAARDDGHRRPALLHQQPAAARRLGHAQRHPRTRRRDGVAAPPSRQDQVAEWELHVLHRRRMRSRASIKGHPIHPMLIPYPFAFLTGGWGFGVAGGHYRQRRTWRPSSRYLVPTGVAAGLLAAVPGIIDYFASVPPDSSGKERARKHALLNTAALALFTAGWLLSRRSRRTARPLLLQALGAAAMSARRLDGRHRSCTATRSASIIATRTRASGRKRRREPATQPRARVCRGAARTSTR